MGDRVAVLKDGILQQADKPRTMYDRPANMFVAGFIGSPAMNLMEGTLSGGTFTGQDVRIDGLPNTREGPVTLGFRAEDSAISPVEGQLSSSIYSIELLGDSTMVTLRAGNALVAVKAAKDYRARIGDPVHALVSPTICHLFDAATGAWLGA